MQNKIISNKQDNILVKFKKNVLLKHFKLFPSPKAIPYLKKLDDEQFYDLIAETGYRKFLRFNDRTSLFDYFANYREFIDFFRLDYIASQENKHLQDYIIEKLITTLELYSEAGPIFYEDLLYLHDFVDPAKRFHLRKFAREHPSSLNYRNEDHARYVPKIIHQTPNPACDYLFEYHHSIAQKYFYIVLEHSDDKEELQYVHDNLDKIKDPKHLFHVAAYRLLKDGNTIVEKIFISIMSSSNKDIALLSQVSASCYAHKNMRNIFENEFSSEIRSALLSTYLSKADVHDLHSILELLKVTNKKDLTLLANKAGLEILLPKFKKYKEMTGSHSDGMDSVGGSGYRYFDWQLFMDFFGSMPANIKNKLLSKKIHNTLFLGLDADIKEIHTGGQRWHWIENFKTKVTNKYIRLYKRLYKEKHS